jgi:hypothetical protein
VTSAGCGTRRALFILVTFVERRKGDDQRRLDRRRTYIDVVERVLGNFLPSEIARPPTIFKRFDIGQRVIGSTVSEVQVYLLADVKLSSP